MGFIQEDTFCVRQKVSEKAREACRPGRGKRLFVILFVSNKKYGKPRSGKGFKFVCAKFWFCALNRGLQNLEAPFGKVLILLVRSCCSGALIRGSENLDVLCKENGLSLFALCKK